MKINKFLNAYLLPQNGYHHLWLIIALLIHRLILAAFLPFSGDEAYHWEWSRHLDFSYYDHPPMTAWLIFIIKSVFGNSLLAIRSTAFLCFFGAMIYVLLLTKKIFGKEAAFYSAYIFIGVPLYAGLSIMITTDPPLLFFWAGSLYYIYSAIFENSKFWILAGIFIGCSLLSKFLAVYLLFSLFAFIILSKQRFAIIKNGYFYLALLIAFVLFTPILYWNYNHDWATFYFNFSKRHHFKFHFYTFSDFLIVQFAIAGVTLSVLMLISTVNSIKEFFKNRNENILFLLCFGLIIFISFASISFSRRIGAHWPACGFLAIIILTSYYVSTITSRKLVRVLIGAPIVLILIISTTLLFPEYISPNLSYKYQEKATTKRLVHFYGWKEAGAELNSLMDQMPGETHIVGESYGVASLMAFYSGRDVPSHVLNLYGIHGLNYYWWDDFSKIKGINGIYVTSTKKKEKPSLTKKELKTLRKAFNHLEIQPPLKIYKRGNHVRTFLFVKCYDLRAPLTSKNPIFRN